jgi:hypothetical protein
MATQWHPSLTPDRILGAAEGQHTNFDNPGFCIKCGAEQDGCKPGTRDCQCESCGERSVFGAAELVMMIAT